MNEVILKVTLRLMAEPKVLCIEWIRRKPLDYVLKTVRMRLVLERKHGLSIFYILPTPFWPPFFAGTHSL